MSFSIFITARLFHQCNMNHGCILLVSFCVYDARAEHLSRAYTFALSYRSVSSKIHILHHLCTIIRFLKTKPKQCGVVYYKKTSSSLWSEYKWSASLFLTCQMSGTWSSLRAQSFISHCFIHTQYIINKNTHTSNTEFNMHSTLIWRLLYN